MWGKGLLQGLAVTWRNLTHRSVTAHYPDVEPDLPPRSRGVIALQEENCTSCMLCARECPSWCITIDSHKQVIPAATEGGRERSQNVLDRFDIDYSLCMYCSICIEVCPFDALHWSPEFAYAEGDLRDLTHDMNRLRTWMDTVPPPQPLDPGADQGKELDAHAATAPVEPPPVEPPPVEPVETPPVEPVGTSPVEPVETPFRQAQEADGAQGADGARGADDDEQGDGA